MTFLRTLFGPSTQEVWRKLCAEIGAQYVDGGFWKGNKVQGAHGPWTITLDTYTVSTGKSSTTYTRMRAPFVDSDGFRFTVYRKRIFSEIGKWLGMQDIEIGDTNFDQDFILKSNQEPKLRELLGSSRIRELINQQPEIYFSVKDDEGFFSSSFPEGVDELYFQVVGVIKDVERLKSLYDLFAETLDQLCRIGAASSNAPNVSL
ncbi:MAG TPA: hypothetical protein VMA34_08200 [Terracidiphilus sp.]|nr:hypothetical protein [Terracidiphilus sp.]